MLGNQLIPAWATAHWAPSVAAVAGHLHISVPAGHIQGVSIGLSFMAGAWSAWNEPTLSKLAYAYEQATRHRRPPRFLLVDPVE